jgi:hypothetical protein
MYLLLATSNVMAVGQIQKNATVVDTRAKLYICPIFVFLAFLVEP